MEPLNLDHNEIMRYLSMPADSETKSIQELIEECKRELFNKLRPRFVYRVFDIEKNEHGIVLLGDGFILPGKDIVNHLDGAEKTIVLALTLGIEAELVIKRYARAQLTKTLVLEAVCTEIIEKYSDQVLQEIIKKEGLTQWIPNFGYGVGYGDLPLSLQPQILSLLDAQRKIGLTCNANHIMIPRKSITSIFGLFVEKREQADSCSICSLKENCQRRKDGFPCGRFKRDEK
ncbi:methionine synthase [Scatolibacter rhodanostii]|uniref:methionine synthase n=1 Tax=Scatolibacter rhodanostii TaxID=2014781 RepID=UPI000C0805CD|nr:methionine synthase [Scatolibacter rhodanostii]